MLGSALSLLFAEASTLECGRQAALDRLAEVVLIYMLRRLMDAPEPRNDTVGHSARSAC
jgi:hypothetical protein